MKGGLGCTTRGPPPKKGGPLAPLAPPGGPPLAGGGGFGLPMGVEVEAGLPEGVGGFWVAGGGCSGGVCIRQVILNRWRKRGQRDLFLEFTYPFRENILALIR